MFTLIIGTMTDDVLVTRTAFNDRTTHWERFIQGVGLIFGSNAREGEQK